MDEISTFLQQFDIYSWQIITLLILAGFAVGFVNTIAGSGTVITYSVFMMLGLPANFANGTIRLGVIMQTLVSTLNFKKHGYLDVKKGFQLGIPVIIGSIVGAQIGATINLRIFEIILGILMLVMLYFIFYQPSKWLKGKIELMQQKPKPLHYLFYFLIGLYGGFIHLGVGIFLLIALVLKSGYDLVRANALKVMIVLLYSPFALGVYALHHQIDYRMGLISAIGNIFGGYVASNIAVKKGAGFVRWFLMAVILFFAIHLFGLI
jgi:uncharacterized membrane protein YfcA